MYKEKPCINCNKLMRNAKFCSRKCSAIYNNTHPESKTLCQDCGQKSRGRLRCLKCYQQYRINSLEERLNNKRIVKNSDLKRTLIQFGIKEHKCEKCYNTLWNNQLIPIELHHIDGNRYNNVLSNLQFLCPNCHAQEPNHGGNSTKILLENKSCNFCSKSFNKKRTETIATYNHRKYCSQKCFWDNYNKLKN